MGIEKDQQRYLRHSDKRRSCDGKIAFSDKKIATQAAGAAKDRGRVNSIRAYKCRHCPFWHIGKSVHIGQSLEERVDCPNGCGKKIRIRRLDSHLERCSESYEEPSNQMEVQVGGEEETSYPSQSDQV